MKSPEKEVLEILNRSYGGMPIMRITEILRSEHRREKYRRIDITHILRRLEKKGLISRERTKYNLMVWRVAK